MDAKMNGKESAAPFVELGLGTGVPVVIHYGLAKRELLAAMFVAAHIANPHIVERYGADPEGTSRCAIKQADALLVELAKEDAQ